MMTDLDQLEAQSIFVLREACHRLRPLGLLWSLGKDSNVLLWLARKAFLGRVPMAVYHVDTGKKFPECMPSATATPRSGASTSASAPVRRWKRSTRRRRRAPRSACSAPAAPATAGTRNQPPEFWDQFATPVEAGAHVRVHPLLAWRELDIWRYVEREGIPVVNLYSTSRATADATARLAIRTSPSRCRAGPGRSRRSWRSCTAPARRSGPGGPWTIGRLLHDTGNLPERRMDAARASSERRGLKIEWSFLLDSLQAERDQGVTIDSTRLPFVLDGRPFVIVDAPGHRQFLRNMVTGAAGAAAAVLVVDVAEGAQERTRRHAVLLRLTGVRHVVVLLNKADLLDFDADRVSSATRAITALLEQLELRPAAVIPASARHGDNVAARSARTGWYRGPTLTEALSVVPPPASRAERPLRLPVQDIYRSGAKRVVVGRIESGRVSVGDTLVIGREGAVAKVATLEGWPGAGTEAEAGQSVVLVLGATGLQMFRRVSLPKIRRGLLQGVLLCSARSVGEFGAVSVVSGRIRGLTNTVPLHIEVLYQEYDIAAAFGVAALLAGVALLTVMLRAELDWRGEALRARGSQARLAEAG